MQVKVFPLDAWGCGFYRMFWPAHYVNERTAVSASSVPPDERKVALELDMFGEAMKEQFPVEAGDVCVFQRPTHSFMPSVIKLMQTRGVAVVIDMDDDLSHIHPSNPSWLMHHPKSQNGHSWKYAEQSCRLADLVTVTTDQLASSYGAHGRVAVIDNCVPSEYLTVPHEDSTEIGWAGSVQTHPQDLQQVGAAIARLVNRGITFRTVGDVREVARALGLTGNPKSTGPVEFRRYPASIAQFGIGIAPLAITRFNQAKSWLKPLEYAAVGVPWVGSPTTDYRKLHAEGCGIIAERPKDWDRALRRLVNDEVARKELSVAGREVANRWTYEGNAWRWAEAWEAAAAHRAAHG